MHFLQEILSAPPLAVKKKKKLEDKQANIEQQHAAPWRNNSFSCPCGHQYMFPIPELLLKRLDLASKANENVCVDYNRRACCEGGWTTAEQR